MVGRKTRKKLVGKTEDIERAERERNLAKIERELHKEWENQTGTEEARGADPDQSNK